MSQDILVDNIIFSPALPEASRPKIAGSNSLQVVSPLTRFTGELTIDSNVGIGTASAGEKLEVAGNIKIIGDSIINGQALKIMQINRPDWLCINPDEGYPGTALYKTVAINNGGLAVGELSQLAPGQLKVTSCAYLATNNGNVGIGTAQPAEKLEVAGNVKISGDSIKNFQGYRIIETNKSDWLRINPDQSYPGIALYKPVAIGTGGLAVGELSQLAQGQLKVTSSAYLATNNGNVGIGTAQPAEKLEVAGNVKISGDSIKNFQGYRIIETNKSDWLRVNPDQSYPGIALHKPVAIGTGGLAIGEWSQLAQGQLKVTSSAFLATNGGNVGIGTATPNPNVKLDVEGGAYLGYANSINDFGGILKSGFYQGTGTITGDVPDTSHDWTHLLTVRHSNTQNNYQLQIAGTYNTNDRLFFRKIAAGLGSSNPSWNEFATRGSNVFAGNQEVKGNVTVSGSAYLGTSSGNVVIGRSGLEVIGKIKSGNERRQVQITNACSTRSTIWEDLVGIPITIDNNPLLIIFQPSSMQALGSHCRVHFRILLNGTQVAGATEEFHNNGWELRIAPIFYLAFPGRGTHNITVQWYIDTGTEVKLNFHQPNWNWQTTQLIAIEL